jgi:hypothetical protein
MSEQELQKYLKVRSKHSFAKYLIWMSIIMPIGLAWYFYDWSSEYGIYRFLPAVSDTTFTAILIALNITVSVGLAGLAVLSIKVIIPAFFKAKDAEAARIREECMRGGIVVKGKVIELESTVTYDDHIWSAVVEFERYGEIHTVLSDKVFILSFKHGDKLDVYLHPTDHTAAHVYLALDRRAVLPPWGRDAPPIVRSDRGILLSERTQRW